MLVDYAHTPDSLENVLRAARELTERAAARRVRRRRRPRPRQAPADGRRGPPAGRPRAGDLGQPAQRGSRRDHRRGHGGRGRRTPSARPTGAARSRWRSSRPPPGDVVVIAGKGHEQGQEFEDGRKEPFDDVTVAREALRRARRGGARVIDLCAGRVGAQPPAAVLAAGDPERAGPARAVIDSRAVEPGDLFVGPAGRGRRRRRVRRRRAGGAGAWGVLVDRAHAHAAGGRGGGRVGHSACSGAAVIAVDDPLAALHALARRLAARAGLQGGRRSPARPARPRPRTSWPRCCARGSRRTPARENWNTEIGLPLTILEAPRGTEALVLEMAMRGEGQIAELAAIAEPDVGVIVNVGPGAPRAARHGRARGGGQGRADPRPAPRRGLRGAGQRAAARRPPARRPRHLDLRPRRRRCSCSPSTRGRAEIEARGERSSSSCRYSEPHNLLNTLAAVAAARALGVHRGRRGGRALLLAARRGRGAPGGVTVVNDCYNANPMSMRAALDHLARSAGRAPDRGARDDGRAGRRARPATTARSARTRPRSGSTCWCRWARRRSATARASRARRTRWPRPEEAGALLEELARPGDRVLVKGSRSVGLERVLAWPMLGEILIGGMASLLICMFLGPRFIEFLRLKEFGQHIREEGPAGHHGKAGTPTMGGLVILLAVCVPFLILSEYRAASLARARAPRWRWRRLGLRRRPDQAAPAALARASRARPSWPCRRSPRSRSGSRSPSGSASRTRCACASWTPRSTSGWPTRC